MFWIIAYGAALGAVGHEGITATIVLLLQQGGPLTQLPPPGFHVLPEPPDSGTNFLLARPK